MNVHELIVCVTQQWLLWIVVCELRERVLYVRTFKYYWDVFNDR